MLIKHKQQTNKQTPFGNQASFSSKRRLARTPRRATPSPCGPVGTRSPQTRPSNYLTRRLPLSRHRQFALEVNKFVIISRAAHQALCASEIIWSFRGFGRSARYPDADPGCPSNKPTNKLPPDGSQTPVLLGGVAPFPFKRSALHRSEANAAL